MNKKSLYCIINDSCRYRRFFFTVYYLLVFISRNYSLLFV